MVRDDVNGNEEMTQWEQCPSGRFQHLSSDLRKRRSRRVFMRQAVAGSIVAIAGAAAFWVWGRGQDESMPEPNYGGITCSETRRRMMSDRELTREIKAKIRRHIAQCDMCRSQLRNHMDRLS